LFDVKDELTLSLIYVINVEWMNDRLSNWSERCQENRRNVGEEWISCGNWPSGWVYNEHTSLFWCDLILFGWRCSPEESKCSLRMVYWWCCWCVLYCREWWAWRWRSHSNCRRIGKEYFTEEIGSWMFVSPSFILHSLLHLSLFHLLRVTCLMWRMNLLYLTFMSSMWNEWMIDCGIGVRGAKRVGKMLEKNESLVEIDLGSEFPLNIPHSSGVI